jgi:PAS domain S-box-containing protein
MPNHPNAINYIEAGQPDEILAAFDEILWAANPSNLQLLYISPSVEPVLGYSASDLLEQPKRWLDMVHEGDRAHVQHCLSCLSPSNPLDLTYSVVRPDSTICQIRNRVRLVPDEEQRSGKLVGIMHHVSELAILSSDSSTHAGDFNSAENINSFLRQMIENFNGVFWLSQASDDRVVYISPSYQQLWGQAIERLYHDPNSYLETVYPDDVEWVSNIFKLNSFSDEVDIEYRIVGLGGSLRWVRDRGFPIKDACGKIRCYAGIVEDITDRKKTELALKQSEERFRVIFEQAAVGIYQTDASGKILEVNECFCRLLGYTRSELLERSDQAITHRDDLPIQLDHFYRIDRGQSSSFSIEKRYLRKDGSVIWTNLAVTQIFDPLRALKLNVTIVQDISDRKRIEEALRRSQRMLRLVMDNIPQRIFWKDYNLVYLGCNQAQADISQLSTPAEIVGKTDYDLPDTRDQADFYRECDRYIIENNVSQYGILSHQRQVNGQLAWIATTKVPLHDDQGEVVGILGTAEDVTHRKQFEDALKVSEEKFAKAFCSSPDAMAIANFSTGQLLEINNSFLDLLEYDRNEVLGCTAIDLKVLEDLEDRVTIRKLLEDDGLVRDYELTLRTRSGQLKTALLSAELMELNGESCVLAIAKDITERKYTETLLRAKIRQERALNQVIQAIRDSLELDTIFTTATEEIARLLDVDRASIKQFLPVEAIWRTITAYCPNPETEDAIAFDIPDRENPITAVLKAGSAIQIDDVNQSDTIISQHLAQIFPGSWLIVPLHLRSPLSQQSLQEPNPESKATHPSVWGCLCLIRNRRGNLGWHETEVEMASAVTNQLAIAIQQSELYQQVQQFNANLEQQVQERTAQLQIALDFEAGLKRVTDSVRDSLDEAQILQTVVRELGQLLNARCISAGIYDLTEQIVRIDYEYSQPDWSSTHGCTIPLEPSFEIHQALLAGRSLQFCLPNPRFSRPRAAILACPIVDDQEILGDLWLFRHSHLTFNNSEIRLVEQLASQCAIAIRQARLYQAVQLQVTELETLNQLKDDFLSTVSHELRTPIANIKMATQMLDVVLSQSETRDPRVERYLEILQDQTRQEMDLINDLLDLQRLEGGSRPSDIAPIQMQNWLPQIADSFESRVQTHQQRLTVMIPPNLPEFWSELSAIKRILVELLNNACKYTPEGGEIQLVARAKPAIVPTTIEISITNTGIEIPEHELPLIFNKFYRIPKADRWKHGGTGLGLALVKQLTEYLGGKIIVTSRQNVTCFTVEFPLSIG